MLDDPAGSFLGHRADSVEFEQASVMSQVPGNEVDQFTETIETQVTVVSGDVGSSGFGELVDTVQFKTASVPAEGFGKLAFDLHDAVESECAPMLREFICCGLRE